MAQSSSGIEIITEEETENSTRDEIQNVTRSDGDAGLVWYNVGSPTTGSVGSVGGALLFLGQDWQPAGASRKRPYRADVRSTERSGFRDWLVYSRIFHR